MHFSVSMPTRRPILAAALCAIVTIPSVTTDAWADPDLEAVRIDEDRQQLPCGAEERQVYSGRHAVRVHQVVRSSSKVKSSGGSSSGGGFDLGDSEAALVIAVIALAALPIVIYAVDSQAPYEVRRKHKCFDVDLGVSGGFFQDASGRNGAGFFGLQATMGAGAIGFTADMEMSDGFARYHSQSAHLLLRLPPKAHVEAAFSLGARRLFIENVDLFHAEFGLPHTYIFDKESRNFGIGVRPSLLVGERGLDARLDISAVVGVTDWLDFEIGGRAFSFDHELRYGGVAAFTFNL